MLITTTLYVIYLSTILKELHDRVSRSSKMHIGLIVYYVQFHIHERQLS